MTPRQIKRLRQTLDVTQENFSQAIGCSVATINRWEKGTVKPSCVFIRILNELKKKCEDYEKKNGDL